MNRTLCVLLLALLLAACSSSDKKTDVQDTTDQTDAVDTTDIDDVTDVTDVTDVDDVPDQMETTDLDPLVPLPTPGELLESITGSAASDLTDTIAADIDNDGYLDLVGIAGSELIIATFDASGGLVPPFTWNPAVTISLADSATHVRVANFDGNTRADLALYDAAGGRLRVYLQDEDTALVDRFDNPIIAFDNPIIAFDNPIIAFDNPIIAFDNPIIATDIDANGLDDIVFAGGNQGLSVGWMQFTSDVMSPVQMVHDQPSGLTDLFPLSEAVPIMVDFTNLDGGQGSDLVIGYHRTNDTDNDGIVFLPTGPGRAFDNPIIAFDNPIIAWDGGMLLTEKGLSDIEVGDVNNDSAADVTWLAGADGLATAGGWLTNGFDNPIIATAPADPVSFNGAHRQLSVGRLFLDQAVGFGASGTDGLNALNATGHLLTFSEDMEDAVAIPVGANRALGLPLALVGSGDLAGAAFDVNGDGFSELASPVGTGLRVVRQRALDDIDLANDNVTLADGSTIPACEVVAPYCDEGRAGVCAFGRKTCGGCSGGQDFVDKFGVDFAAAFEPGGETLCDGLDNDCNGLIDDVPGEWIGGDVVDPTGRMTLIPWNTGYGVIRTYTPGPNGVGLFIIDDPTASIPQPYNGPFSVYPGTRGFASAPNVVSSGTELVIEPQDGSPFILFDGSSWADQAQFPMTRDEMYITGPGEVLARVLLEVNGDITVSVPSVQPFNWQPAYPYSQILAGYSAGSDHFFMGIVDDGGLLRVGASATTVGPMLIGAGPDVLLPLDSTRLMDARMTGDNATACVTALWDPRSPERLTALLVPINPDRELEVINANSVLLSTGPVVADSVHVAWVDGGCKVTWLEHMTGAMTSDVRAVTLDAFGNLLFDAALAPVDVVPPARGHFSVAYNNGERYVGRANADAVQVTRVCQ